MKPVRILCPTGHLSFTPLEKDSFLLGCQEKPDFIVADAGSCDMGPRTLPFEAIDIFSFTKGFSSASFMLLSKLFLFNIFLTVEGAMFVSSETSRIGLPEV